MGYTTQGIRNVALVGQAGSGKTLLTEALLLEAGAIRSKGSLQRGTTVSDFDPQEKQLRHSLDSAICSFDCGDVHLNLIDTPGYPDFLGRTLSVLEAVESVGIVVSAATGVDSMTQRYMEFARDRELCRLVIVNRMDGRDAHPEAVLEQLRERFGSECLPINLPSQGGSSVVDCFFSPQNVPTDFSSVESAHTQIVDQVVEVDEELMALYLEQGQELSPEQLHDPFEKALREGHLVPVCFVSAETGAGVPQLLEVLKRLMPNPMEGNPPPFMKGSGEQAVRVRVSPDPSAHVVAHVFRISIDPYVGKLGVIRVHQGTIRTGAQLFVGDARKPFKVAHLYRLMGKDTVEVPQAIPGDICALAKVDELHFDAVLHDSHDEDEFHLKSIVFPPAMLGIAIEPERRGDEQRLADALHKLTAEDPCVRVEHNAAVNETVLYGMGEFHLRVLLERMAERYGVRVKTHPPSIPYRETITRAADGHHRHKKQTGGAGQFGEVFLRVEPLERGAGFEFVDEVVGGAIPGQFIPAVEKGVRQALAEGAIAGFPIQDVRVVVYDGKHHPVDSKEIAFVTAGRKAFLDAVQKAGPIVLEPIVRVEITAPSSSIGDITGDLATKRARINGNSTLPGQRARVTALVPLAEMTDYQSRLKALTGGEGTYSMEFSHHDPAPVRRQQELMQAWKPREAEA
ncbi:MAG: elongation factor G [Pseudomonadota bacterium]|jgi:small GTP-binding protein domain|nr:MAG: elongation factor G [Pseudomonadota bacterium]